MNSQVRMCFQSYSTQRTDTPQIMPESYGKKKAFNGVEEVMNIYKRETGWESRDRRITGL